MRPVTWLPSGAPYARRHAPEVAPDPATAADGAPDHAPVGGPGGLPGGVRGRLVHHADAPGPALDVGARGRPGRIGGQLPGLVAPDRAHRRRTAGRPRARPRSALRAGPGLDRLHG